MLVLSSPACEQVILEVKLWSMRFLICSVLPVCLPFYKIHSPSPGHTPSFTAVLPTLEILELLNLHLVIWGHSEL